MSITPFLKYAAFDQDDIKAMSTAFDEVCGELQINGDKTAREIVAMRIIELAKRGERSPAKLRERVLGEANGDSSL